MAEHPEIQSTNAHQGLLGRIEKMGNLLPHPTLIFIYLCGFMLLFSGIAGWLAFSANHPVSGEPIVAKSLLSGDGLRWIVGNTVTNFTGFAPVGTVLVAILGIGIAERSGLLAAVLSSLAKRGKKSLLSFMVVFAGVLSSLAADTGYVVLIPLAAVLFLAAGRHPLAGIAAAFAGVSGGYSANLLIGPLDAILAGISTEAAQLVDASYQITAAGNYYFILASTFLVALVGTWVTEKIIAPRLGEYSGQQLEEEVNFEETLNRKALMAVGMFTLAYVVVLLLLTVPATGILRNPETGSLLRSPFISGIVTIIALYAAIAGWLYGKLSGRFANSEQLVVGMESTMATMASYLVLMFFAAQFVNYFGWSQLGAIAAIKGAELLQAMDPGAGLLLVSFVLFAALINLLVGSASAKWALMAPIFVPMLLLVGISPEATQVAYRIGDSSTNIITPLMPYFGVVVAFVQRYDKQAGIGTMLALMLPYSIALLLGWSLLLAAWIALGIPLGPDAPILIGL